VAIDFETADYGPDSACAVGLVRVDRRGIVERKVCLLRPPRNDFRFTYLHGIEWKHVADQPTFREAWPGLSGLLEGAAYLAAHNSGFDRAVLQACCTAAGLPPPALPFLCTMRLARHAWDVRPTKLPDVCAFLGLKLKHHDAGSDAEACARIILAARERLR
jgi:DNA polymerase-3 subunit epsilon